MSTSTTTQKFTSMLNIIGITKIPTFQNLFSQNTNGKSQTLLSTNEGKNDTEIESEDWVIIENKDVLNCAK